MFFFTSEKECTPSVSSFRYRLLLFGVSLCMNDLDRGVDRRHVARWLTCTNLNKASQVKCRMVASRGQESRVPEREGAGTHGPPRRGTGKETFGALHSDPLQMPCHATPLEGSCACAAPLVFGAAVSKERQQRERAAAADAWAAGRLEPRASRRKRGPTCLLAMHQGQPQPPFLLFCFIGGRRTATTITN